MSLRHCRVVLFQGQEKLFRLLFPTRRVQDSRCLSVSLPCHVVSGSGEAVPSAVPHPPRPGRPLSLSHCRVVLFQGQEKLFRLLFPTRRVQDGRCLCLTAVSCCFRVRRGCSVCCSPPAASRTAAVSVSLPCRVVSGSGEAVPSAVPHPPRPGRPLSLCLTAVTCCFRVRRGCSVCCSPPATSRTAAVSLSHCRDVLFQGQEKLFRLLFPTRRVQDSRVTSFLLQNSLFTSFTAKLPDDLQLREYDRGERPCLPSDRGY